jgi:hypothetical protein
MAIFVDNFANLGTAFNNVSFPREENEYKTDKKEA